MSTRAVWTEQLANDITFPHIDIYRRYKDGVHDSYRVAPQEGYVFYDTTEEQHMYQDSPESEPYYKTHYYTIAYLPLRFNFDNFSYVAVPRSEVEEDYIFGGNGEPEHEVM